MKVGIIRCQLTEDTCPGSTDFKVAKEGTLAFEETGPVEIIGFLPLTRPGTGARTRPIL